MMCDVLSLCLGSLIEIVVLFTYIMCYFQENLSIAFKHTTIFGTIFYFLARAENLTP